MELVVAIIKGMKHSKLNLLCKYSAYMERVLTPFIQFINHKCKDSHTHSDIVTHGCEKAHQKLTKMYVLLFLVSCQEMSYWYMYVRAHEGSVVANEYRSQTAKKSSYLAIKTLL